MLDFPFLHIRINNKLALTILILNLTSISGCKRAQPTTADAPPDWTATEAEAHMEEAFATVLDENSDEYFDINNPWHLDYFKNEWGETDTSHPMIYTTLQGTGWNIHVDYQLGGSQASSGTFRFYIVDNDGVIQHIFGPAYIYVRGEDGQTSSVPVTGVQNSVVFVENPSTVKYLIHHFNQDYLDILIEFEKYNERHSTKARWESTSGFFERAIKTMLNGTVVSETYEEDFVPHLMEGFFGTYILKGLVGDASCLTMKLTFEHGSVTGSCKYDDDRIWHSVKGNLANLGTMILTEYDSKGVEVLEYSGNFNGEVFQGDCIAPDNDTCKPFYLAVQ